MPLPIVIGLDISGEIAEIGAGVNGWSVGDRILVNPLDPITPEKGLMGEMLDGGTAELCGRRHTSDQDTRWMLLRAGGGAPVAYGTAHRMMITNGRMKGGEKVLILGASVVWDLAAFCWRRPWAARLSQRGRAPRNLTH